ncbi:MAG TPA: DHA2 family efflux MFS transporter permease subunit [Caulobacteraceae bacterium]|nr:DHA2 family efflux MFS transporter permease subunit [Caulobacteraceae bacterium]
MTTEPAGKAAARPGDVGRAAWLAFATLCLGDMMIVLDSTIVNVALPSVRTQLGFDEAGLSWVVNAFLLTFGGFLLLGGRLADLYGQRRLFIYGVIGFTIASLACGLAPTREVLIVARAAQGVVGAVVGAVALALIMQLFPDGPARVRAMGYFGFISAGGGSVGVLLGGLIVGLLDWRWVFLINLPVGLAVWALALKLLPPDRAPETRPRLDVVGAALVTAAIMLAVYGIVGGEQVGWASPVTWGFIAAGVVLLGAFLAWETKTREPLMPLDVFASRNVATANVVAVLWAAAMFAWFFLSALYLQLVLGYTPMQVGLAFLPGNLIMGAFSYKLSAITVTRFGIRWPMVTGLLLAAAGLGLFALAPVEGDFWIHVLPPMLLLGLGAGLAFNPVLLAAMNDVEPDRAGLASGVVNTAFMMGGALGLAILASLAASVTGDLNAAGAETRASLNGGYRIAFMAGAVCAALAALIGGVFIRPKPQGEGAPDLAH